MFPEDFQTNLIELHTAVPNLSNAILADMLGLKNRTSINNLESGAILPSVPVLLCIADLFGVNTDWLVGRGGEKYSLTTLLLLEDSLIQSAVRMEADPIPLAFYRLFIVTSILDSEYKSPKKRANLYSLSDRAEIIFCMTVLQRASVLISIAKPDLSLGDINFGTLQTVILPMIKKRTRQKATNDDIQSSLTRILDTLKTALFPVLKERNGKTTANNAVQLWTECYHKLQKYAERG